MKNVGLQLYSIGGDMAKSVNDSLKRVSELGYTQVEFAGYFGIPAAEMKKMLDGYGLKAVSSHTNVFGDISAEIEYLNVLGAKDIVCPGGIPFDTEEGVKAAAENFNKIAEKVKAGGLKLGYHNHFHEFKRSDKGEWLLDVFYRYTDPQLVNMQLDVCWATVGGADPIEYLKKNINRISTVHAKEVLTVSPYEGTAIGEGIVDFKGIYNLLGEDAIFIVEQEGLPHMETWEGLRRSAEYLKKL